MRTRRGATSRRKAPPSACETRWTVERSAEFVDLITVKNQIALSMDGKGCWRDNVFIERFWRSLKYEEVYLHAYDSMTIAKASITRYINFYNGFRPHSALDGCTPDNVYFHGQALTPAA